MLHSDWFSLIALVTAKVSITDMMQGDNGNIKVLLWITLFIYQLSSDLYDLSLWCCILPLMALYNNISRKTKFMKIFKFLK